MGIDLAAAQLLCCGKSMGVDFADTLMLGRQTINSQPADVGHALAAIGIYEDPADRLDFWEFAEPLFRLLGARNIRSLDASGYQRATYIHDLNEPLPPALAKQFSVVFDGGTIEHVFNVVQAYKSGMEMVRIGGHFVQVTVANNFMGHGFWQMSPELIFRMFSRENGFETKGVFLHEAIEGGSWYKVTDPAACRLRVELCNDQPTYICTIAQRISEAAIFASPPQQSDYVEDWIQAGEPLVDAPGTTVDQQAAPPIAPHAEDRPDEATGAGPSGYRQFDAPYFKQVSSQDLIRGRI